MKIENLLVRELCVAIPVALWIMFLLYVVLLGLGVRNE